MERPQLCVSICTCVSWKENGLWLKVGYRFLKRLTYALSSCNFMTGSRISSLFSWARRRAANRADINHPVANQGSIPSHMRGTERLAFKLPLQFQAQKSTATQAVSAATTINDRHIPTYRATFTTAVPVDATRFHFESPGAICNCFQSTICPSPALFSCLKGGLIDRWDGSRNIQSAPARRFPRYPSRPLSQLSIPARGRQVGARRKSLVG